MFICPNTFGCPHMFRHPLYIWMPQTFGCPYIWMLPYIWTHPHTSVCHHAPLYICMFLGGICIWYGDGGHLYTPYYYIFLKKWGMVTATEKCIQIYVKHFMIYENKYPIKSLWTCGGCLNVWDIQIYGVFQHRGYMDNPKSDNPPWLPLK